MVKINIDAYSDALVILGTAGLLIPVFRRWGVNPILGYLGAGAVLGPLGLGSLLSSFPFLYWFTVIDAKNVAGIADLGVVFLLFVVGLELSWKRLTTMRRLVFGLGGLQVILTSTVLAAIAAMAGQKASVAIVVGTSLALSSTAIVLELLSNQGRLATSAGRACFSVLLAQDLAVIPLLIFVSFLGAGLEGSVITSLAIAVVQAAGGIAIIILIGRFLLRPLFELVAGARSTELFIAAVLFVIVGAGMVAHEAGLSMALGAFLAGLMLAETEYGKAIESTIEPFKGLLLGIFFFTIGMNIDAREFLRDPGLLILSVVGMIGLKAAILTLLTRMFGHSWPAATEVGLLLGPGGEFAFVSIGAASALGLMEGSVSAFVLALTSLTMALTPLFANATQRLRLLMATERASDPELAVEPPSGERHAIVVGYGRVGKVVCSLLQRHGIRYIAVDSDASSVARDRRDGHLVFYGAADDPAFLLKCGIEQATGLIITIDTQAIDQVVEHVRSIRPDILIVSRARDAGHACHLYSIGATDAVPETIEASLQLAEAALIGLNVATGLAIASIHEKRDELRRALQRAAGEAGRDRNHSAQAKSPKPPSHPDGSMTA